MRIVIIAIAVVAIAGFVYFVITRNLKDQKELEDELNERELSHKKDSDPKI